MPSVQIKNVPEDVHRVFRERAARNRQSLQEYLLAHLIAEAKQKALEEVFDDRDRNGGRAVPTAAIVEAIQSGRDRR